MWCSSNHAIKECIVCNNIRKDYFNLNWNLLSLNDRSCDKMATIGIKLTF